MCGLAGAVTTRDALPVDETTLRAMRDVIAHRGPDDAGLFLQPGVALASRRLAILDLSPRGHMPMASGDGRFVIAYNGEVYNYRELRAGLERQGRQFASDTDTEVVLALYAERGAAMLSELNGMFAFAIWDRQERQLFAARDRLGVKPFYYATVGDTLFFGSEQKALFQGGVPAQFDHAAWGELLCFLYVAGEPTPFLGVSRLLPGHSLTWRQGKLSITRWWNLGERALARRSALPADPAEWYRGQFDDAIALRRISDVPVGLLLSGGLDSSSVAAALALQAGAGIASFTMRFSEPGYDEGPLARLVADRWNLDHHELLVSSGDLPGQLTAASWLNDEPLAHDSDLHIHAIARYARERVTVLLSGEGSDETLGGYSRYQPLRVPSLLAAARPVVPPVVRALGLGGRAAKLARFLGLGTIDDFVLYNSANVLPSDLAALGLREPPPMAFRRERLAEAKQVYPADPVRQAMYYDTHAFLCSLLDRNDRMTMGASIECRVPFLDYRLVEMLAALPTPTLVHGRRNKALLRRALGDRLPAEVLAGRKWGFAVPWARHLREVPELRSFLVELPSAPIVLDGPLDTAAVRRLVNGFLGGDDAQYALVKHLFMVAWWHKAYFSRLAGSRAASPGVGDVRAGTTQPAR